MSRGFLDPFKDATIDFADNLFGSLGLGPKAMGSPRDSLEREKIVCRREFGKRRRARSSPPRGDAVLRRIFY